MKKQNRLQQMLNTIALPFSFLKNIILRANALSTLVSGQFKKTEKQYGLFNWIKINIIYYWNKVMGIFKSSRLIERQRGIVEMRRIKDNYKDVYLIHYSCESFSNLNGQTPRVLSISILNYDNSQVETYSIHLEAQILKLNYMNLSIEELDKCEKALLDKYYSFIESNSTKIYVHWLMTTVNYGFNAIDMRYTILGGKPKVIENKFKINLPEILCFIYTYGWESDGDGGRLNNSAKRNRMSRREFLLGSDEAKKYDEKDWISLQNSTISKVKIFKNIIEHVLNGKLKTKSGVFEIYGISLNGFREIINNNSFLTIIWWLIILLFGIFLDHFFIS